MEDPREGDCRVPLISSIFLICLGVGGAFLVLYVFAPSLSEPWFPVAAFVMIGIPWVFWFVTYIYACTKHCVRRATVDERKVSKRNYGAAPSRNAAGSASSKNTVDRNVSISRESGGGDDYQNSCKEGKHVQFAEVVVLGEESSRNQKTSYASSNDSEMPLNGGASSS